MKKQRYWLYRRAGIYYLHDSETGVRESLLTRNKQEAEQIRTMRNMSAEHPVIGISLAKACLTSQDPKLLSRTWQDVINEFCSRGKPQTQAHRRRVASRKPQLWLKNMKLIETTADDFVKILKAGGVMTNTFVRCLQNLAVGLGWLPWPILPPRLWPKVEFKKKRAITREEHERIVNTENNAERRRYYEMLWETGAAQTDAALLRAECVDWQRRTISYQRQKTGEWAHLQIGGRLEELLRLLPSEGLLFPAVARSNNSARSSEFCRRCRLLHIQGVSLHSYRYAWAQRACTAGYPERFAQEALGHNSSAVHRAYARDARVVVPSLEDYERRNRGLMEIPLSETNGRQPAGMA
jgi:integrase